MAPTFRGQAPTWLWDSPRLRQALVDHELGEAVRLVREAAGLTQEQMGALVPGWNKQMVHRVETGARGTLFDIRGLLAWADAVAMPREALLPVILGIPDATVEISPSGHCDEEDVDRRTFHGTALALTAGALFPAAVAPVDRVGYAHLHYLQACTEELYARDWAIGGASLLRQATLLFQQTKNLIGEAEYPNRLAPDLLGVCANLGVCASFIAFDAGDLATARRLIQDARELADGTEDGSLRAHVYAIMALQSTSLARLSGRRGPAREALRFLDRAEEAARYEMSPKLRALINMRRATAAGLQNEEHTARTALRTAYRDLDRGPHPDDRPWFGFVTHAEVRGHEAQMAVDTGDFVRAASLYQATLQEPMLPQRNRTFYQAQLANAQLKQGDRRGAFKNGRSALTTLEESVGSVRALNILRPLRDLGDEEFADRFATVAVAMSREYRAFHDEWV
ncbi:helix-turn-helix transcriptional regulator [Actinomadura syzygii]|uniref:Helix-turn-helix transcriptional regulator n=1 Tax=Actinomadura syzygii TaxID=1427538 RepID=A0A5D0TSF2_9ACTN|nr:helix-turn-helix transcriptional regulator [Actinomadura syzygii]TYC08643.1 helix-turn-helix transcriptional regulator [Actinomadura syzygii]